MTLRSFMWLAITILALMIAEYAIAILLSPGARSPFVVDIISAHSLIAYAHFAGGGVALAVGAFQFNKRLRSRFLNLHRWMGRIYVTAVTFGGAASLVLASTSSGGLVANIGFGALGVCWVGSTLRAYWKIRQRDVSAHRSWMIRSYALTLAAVTLRLYIPGSQALGMSIAIAYPAIAWLCWVPNLLVAEWMVAEGSRRGLRSTKCAQAPKPFDSRPRIKRLFPEALMNKAWLATTICFCVLAGNEAAGACRYTGDRAAQASTREIKHIVVRAGAGSLKVVGERGRESVEATGQACASSNKLLQEIRIVSSTQGDTLFIDTQIPDTTGVNFLFSLFGDYASLDLTVRVPSDAPLTIEDSSGDMEVRSVHSADITDGSGDTRIDGVEADLKIKDSSGDLDIRNVGGTVQVTDTSGDIAITSVKGDVLIPVDTSGDIRVSDVEGGVHIEQDTSGGIYVRNVKKDVVVDSDTSGEIRVDAVGGNFRVGVKSSGSIHHDRVSGKVQIPSRD